MLEMFGRMGTKRRLGSIVGALLACGITAAVALGDTIDADVVSGASGNQQTRDLGNVASGATLTAPVNFQLNCAGNKHVDANQSVTMSLSSATLDGAAAGTNVSATTSTIPAPGTAWPADGKPCPGTLPAGINDNGDSIVTIKAPAALGAYRVVVAYEPSLSTAGSNDPSSITGSTSVTFIFTVTNADTDDDGVNDSSDNCPSVSNANQANADGDAFGDVCDSDRDGDGVANTTDNCPDAPNAGQADADADGQGAACDDNDAAPAVGSAAADATGDEGKTLTASGSFTDADGTGTLTITSTGAGTVTALPDGTWSWSLPTTDNGIGTVTVSASDGEHAAATDTFTWSAANVAPSTPGTPALASGSSSPNNTGQFTLKWDSSTDVSGDTVSYTLKKKDVEFPRFGGQGLITQPRWLVSL